MNSTLAPASRQRTCTSNVQTRTPDGSRPDPAGWINRIPIAAIDARLHPDLGHRFGWMLLFLEHYCRTRCYCWVSNAELFAAFGCSQSTGQEILKAMEEAELIQRVRNDRGRPGRVGIILRRRINLDLPTASAEEIPEVIRLMRAALTEQREWRRGQVRLPFPGASSTRESRSSAPGNPGPSRTRFSGYGIKTLSLENDELENDGPEEEIFPRQRPEGPPSPPRPALTAEAPAPTAAADPPAARPEAPPPPAPIAPAPVAAPAGARTSAERPRVAAVLAPAATLPAAVSPLLVAGLAATFGLAAPAAPRRRVAAPSAPSPVVAPSVATVGPASVAAAPAPPPPALTPGQEHWLATLSPDQRQRFDALPVRDRERLLAPHRAGLCEDRILAGEAGRLLGPKVAAPPPPPLPGPNTPTPELIRTLAEVGPWQGKGVALWCVQALVHDLADDNPISRRRYEKLCQEVARGIRPAASLLEPYERTMERLQRGEVPLPSAGRYFNASVQNWDREHPEALREAPLTPRPPRSAFRVRETCR